MMNTTTCIINIDMSDVTAKDDAVLSVTNNAIFADAEKLNNETNNLPDYMSLCWNHSLLDGNMQVLENTLVNVGYPVFSRTLSDENGTLLNGCKIQVSFSNVHSSAGLTFTFIDTNVPKNIEIEWYKDKKLLSSKIFDVNSTNFYCENKVENYNKIFILFVDTLFPYRYIEMNNIKYGIELNKTSDSIISASIVEELDPISSELSINTASFTLLDKENMFNALNENGYFSLMQNKQKITFTEIVNGEEITMGTFYLENWSSEQLNKANFNLIDALGIIDKTDFKKGQIYVDEPAGNIIDAIMDSANWSKYTVTNEVRNALVSGYIPVCSHREALQQVVFAVRAVADCSRSDCINIYRQSQSFENRIMYSRQFLGSSTIKTKQPVTNLQITAYKYTLSSDTKELFDGVLLSGTNEIIFDNPCLISDLSEGTILERGVNYCIVNMVSAGSCVITGREYEAVTSNYISNTDLETGQLEQIKKITNATLISKNNVYLISQHILNYYNMQRVASVKYLLNNEKAGEWVAFKSFSNLFIIGSIERQTIDLIGGFIAKADIVGYNTTDIEQFFCGLELYAGSEIGVV